MTMTMAMLNDDGDEMQDDDVLNDKNENYDACEQMQIQGATLWSNRRLG